MGFSLAQAFTPGCETGGATEAPLMGLLKLSRLRSPGVNAWATEKSFNLGHYPFQSYLVNPVNPVYSPIFVTDIMIQGE